MLRYETQFKSQRTDGRFYSSMAARCLAFNYINAPDHSFREEPSIRLLKKCFGL